MSATLSYCVSSAPNAVTLAEARTLLNSAISALQGPASLASGQALTLTHHNPCQTSTVVTISAANLGSTGPGARTSYSSPDSATISMVFNTYFTWWNGTGTRPSASPSYQGVLTHEMGHTVGMGHSGGPKWSFDNTTPTMTDQGTPATTPDLTSVQQDDASMAHFIKGGDPRYFTPNSGFEDSFQYWGRTSGATVSTSAAYTGTRGVRIPVTTDYVYTSVLYDPYKEGTSNTLAPNMTASVTYRGRAHFRNPTCCKTRGFNMKYQYRYLRYDTTKAKSTADGTATWTTWSAMTAAGGCGASSPSGATSWGFCSGSVALTNDATNDATALSWYFHPYGPDGHVDLDQVGILASTGGMS